MEKRSRRRIRDLVTQSASQGLSQNEIGSARISMMAKSTHALFTGRIQKRKTNPLHHSRLACNTRPVHTNASFASFRVRAGYFRFAPNCRHIAASHEVTRGASKRRTALQQNVHSINSSAAKRSLDQLFKTGNQYVGCRRIESPALTTDRKLMADKKGPEQCPGPIIV